MSVHIFTCPQERKDKDWNWVRLWMLISLEASNKVELKNKLLEWVFCDSVWEQRAFPRCNFALGSFKSCKRTEEIEESKDLCQKCYWMGNLLYTHNGSGLINDRVRSVNGKEELALGSINSLTCSLFECWNFSLDVPEGEHTFLVYHPGEINFRRGIWTLQFPKFIVTWRQHYIWTSDDTCWCLFKK